MFIIKTKREKTKMRFRTTKEIKTFLMSKVFIVHGEGWAYLFEGEKYARFMGDFSLFNIHADVIRANIKPKHRYSIFQYESNFIFRTYKNELCSNENEFIISVNRTTKKSYSVAFMSVGDKIERLRLIAK
jgi:hypothetical protein